jgi:biopolymer transport protein ExbB
VAIPALMFYRYLDNRVDKLIVAMEEQALRLIEVMQGAREAGDDGSQA